jgi:hypothetical protein
MHDAQRCGCRGLKVITGKGTHSASGSVLGPEIFKLLSNYDDASARRHPGHIDVVFA